MKKKEIKKQKRELKEMGDLTQREQLLTSLKRKAHDNVIFLQGQLENCAKTHRLEKQKWEQKPSDPEELPSFDVDAHCEAKLLRVGAWSAVVIEILLSAYLFATSLAFPWMISVLVGVFIALGLTFIYKAGIGHYLIDHENPKRSYRRLKTLSLIGLIIVTILLIPVIVARTLPQAAHFAWLSGGISAFILSAVSGLLLVAAHVRDWQYRLFCQYLSLIEEMSENQSFLEELEKANAERVLRTPATVSAKVNPTSSIK